MAVDTDTVAPALEATTTAEQTSVQSAEINGTKKERLFCWTVCAYRRPGMSAEDYHRYMSEKHAPLVRDLMCKYGIVGWSMVHNTAQTTPLLSRITGPQFDNPADYDCFVQATFRDIEDFVRMKADPFYRQFVVPDHEEFADTKRSKMTVGWIEHHIIDNKVVLNN